MKKKQLPHLVAEVRGEVAGYAYAVPFRKRPAYLFTYGAGLAELRMGEALSARPRADYVISTQVGRIILDEIEDASARDMGEKSGVFEHGRPNKVKVPTDFWKELRKANLVNPAAPLPGDA
jgi:hypothetical protein